MKKIYLLFAGLLIAFSARAQQDTILFLNFEGIEDPTLNWGIYPFGDDTTFINLDADGLEPSEGGEAYKQWFWLDFFFSPDGDTTVNKCLASLSYMVDFAPGNRNWLIFAPIQVSNENYTLHWKSAPFQLPRYLDGYAVLVSEGSNDPTTGDYKDTLFRAASMDQIVVGDGQTINISDFSFTPGYIHSNALQDTNYYQLYAPGDSSLCRGILEPHSVSLSQYSGKKIYIAFCHDADDDYYLAIDDILITTFNGVGTNALSAENLRFVTYPNPVENHLNVLYRLPEPANVAMKVFTMDGKLVYSGQSSAQLPAGEQSCNLDLGKLKSGAYTLSLEVGNQTFTKIFVKK